MKKTIAVLGATGSVGLQALDVASKRGYAVDFISANKDVSKMEELMRRRSDKQPLNFSSAGSTFKRPEGYFAGALIEQAGLKGRTVGGAQVSEKHAGFVINIGGATAADITELIAQVQAEVLERFGVSLETEVRIIGE